MEEEKENMLVTPLDLEEAENFCEGEMNQEEESPGEEALTSISQINQPEPSQVGKTSGADYVAKLTNQLNEERGVREKLEAELSDLHNLTLEIQSQLNSI